MYKCISSPTIFSALLEIKRHVCIFHSNVEVYHCQQGTLNFLRTFHSLRALYRHIEAGHVLPVITISEANDVEPHDHEISADRESVDHVAANESDVHLDKLQFVREIFFGTYLATKKCEQVSKFKQKCS